MKMNIKVIAVLMLATASLAVARGGGFGGGHGGGFGGAGRGESFGGHHAGEFRGSEGRFHDGERRGVGFAPYGAGIATVGLAADPVFYDEDVDTDSDDYEESND